MGVANVVRCGVALGVRTLWQVGWGYELQRRRCRSHGGSILSCSDGPDFVLEGSKRKVTVVFETYL